MNKRRTYIAIDKSNGELKSMPRIQIKSFQFEYPEMKPIKCF